MIFFSATWLPALEITHLCSTSTQSTQLVKSTNKSTSPVFSSTVRNPITQKSRSFLQLCSSSFFCLDVRIWLQKIILVFQLNQPPPLKQNFYLRVIHVVQNLLHKPIIWLWGISEGLRTEQCTDNFTFHKLIVLSVINMTLCGKQNPLNFRPLLTIQKR